MFIWYIDRTRSHIASVREFGRKTVKFLKDEDWCCLLRANLIRHDHDKIDDSVFIAHYAPLYRQEILRQRVAGQVRAERRI